MSSGERFFVAVETLKKKEKKKKKKAHMNFHMLILISPVSIVFV